MRRSGWVCSLGQHGDKHICKRTGHEQVVYRLPESTWRCITLLTSVRRHALRHVLPIINCTVLRLDGTISISTDYQGAPVRRPLRAPWIRRQASLGFAPPAVLAWRLPRRHSAAAPPVGPRCRPAAELRHLAECPRPAGPSPADQQCGLSSNQVRINARGADRHARHYNRFLMSCYTLEPPAGIAQHYMVIG